MAAAGSLQSNTLSVEDKKSGLSYLVDTGAEVSVYPASAQDRRTLQPSNTLSAANGTSIRTWGKRTFSLVFDSKRQNTHQFYLADVTRPILGADFFTANGLAIDLRGKRPLSLDNVSFLLKESQSSPTLFRCHFKVKKKCIPVCSCKVVSGNFAIRTPLAIA